MSISDRRLEGIYHDLSQVLRGSQNFGLGSRPPRQLEIVLERALCSLSEVMHDRYNSYRSFDGDLEAELSQDADTLEKAEKST